MLLLTATTDKLQVVTSVAADVDVHASYMDHSSGTVTPGRQNTAITTATTTDVVSSPAASTQRNIKFLQIRNKDTADATNVTVVYNQNGTSYELHKVTLGPGDALEYADGVGFFELEVAPTEGLAAVTVDVSNSTTTPAEITELTLTTGIGTFLFEYYIIHRAAATSTGIKFSVNHTGTLQSFVADVRYMNAGTPSSQDQDNVDFSGYYSGYAARSASAAGWAATASIDSSNSNALTLIEGVMVVTADGDIELWHASEVAAASTIKAGSALKLTKVA